MVLNSPCNPTGKVLKEAELHSIAQLLRRHPQIILITDEIYEFLIDDNETHISLKSIAPDLEERIFIVNGFAKAWAMTGWRVGYIQGNEEIINKAIALQSQSTSNVCSFAQRGALAAILEKPSGIEYMINSYNKRRKHLTKAIQNIRGLTLVPQGGAFYTFPMISTHFGNSLDFCKRALETQGLAIVPGIAFGNNQCIRISCSVSEDKIDDGISRLKKVIKEI